MFQVIAAAFGVVGSIDKSASAQYLMKQSGYQSGIDFERNKDLSYYTALKNQSLVIGLIAVAGFAFIMFIVYQSRKK